MWLIYKFTSPSGKSYIGQTNNLDNRIRVHQIHTGCRAIHNAISKYGWASFQIEILADNLSIDEANNLETKFILEHNTLSPTGYNLKLGGDSHSPSLETRTLISNSKQNVPRPPHIQEDMRTRNIRIPRSESTKQKISETMSGRIMSEDHKRKIGQANKGRSMSEEEKQKRRDGYARYRERMTSSP